MKQTIIILTLALTLTLAFLGNTIAAESGKGAPQTKCPVMGSAIDRNIYQDFQGRRVYFCCSGCINSFNKQPEMFIERMAAQGITLDKSR